MPPWKPLLAVAPAGLLLGLVAGHATRPVMLVKEEAAWPYSSDELARETDRWPSFDLSGPGAAARGYSHRPDIDYDLYVWPDQTDRSAELLAADYDYGAGEVRFESEGDLPLTRRAVGELAGLHTERPRPESNAVMTATGAVEPSGPTSQIVESDRSAFVLPPVPPPLARAGTLPEPAGSDEADVF